MTSLPWPSFVETIIIVYFVQRADLQNSTVQFSCPCSHSTLLIVTQSKQKYKVN